MKPKNLLLVDENDDCAIKVSLLMMMIDIVKVRASLSALMCLIRSLVTLVLPRGFMSPEV
jgi:hypothetical protein